MDVAALITWLITAVGGFILLGTWIAKGGHRTDSRNRSRLRPPVVFSGFLLAAAGLVLWIIYVASDGDSLNWISFAIVAVVAVLGFSMFFRWLPQVRGRVTAAVSGTGTTAERPFPVAVVVLHGLFAATLVLVPVAALNA